MIHKNKRLSQIDLSSASFCCLQYSSNLKAIFPAVGGRYLDGMNLKEFIEVGRFR